MGWFKRVLHATANAVKVVLTDALGAVLGTGENPVCIADDVYLTRYVGADPVAGQEAVSQTVPPGRTWEIITAKATLVTNAVAGSRYPYLVIRDAVPANIGPNIPCGSSTHAPSTTWFHQWSKSAFKGTDGNTNSFAPFPDKIIIPEGWAITTITGFLNAGDNWGPIELLVLERRTTLT